MTLAARCPACGTVFRVVQDQLRVSEGWVRCGRCAEVFNAIETLVDLDTEADRAASAGKPDRERERDRVLEALARVSRPAPLDAPRSRRAPEPPPPEPAEVDLPLPVEEPPAFAAGSNDVAVASFMAVAARDEDTSAPPAAAALPPPDAPVVAETLAPEFVRRADRAARWRRPGVRLALACTALLAGMTLALQVLMVYRDLAAARWPGLQPLLAGVCQVGGCTLGAPRMIEALVVESSGLTRTEGGVAYRLAVVLRNRATFALAPPALELTLTDTQGSTIARRVVTLPEMGLQATSIAAGADLPLQALLTAGERVISGYTIEVFYP